MNYLKLFILLSPIILFLTSCENDEDNSGTMKQVESIIDYNPTENYKGSYDITLQRNIWEQMNSLPEIKIQANTHM